MVDARQCRTFWMQAARKAKSGEAVNFAAGDPTVTQCVKRALAWHKCRVRRNAPKMEG